MAQSSVARRWYDRGTMRATIAKFACAAALLAALAACDGEPPREPRVPRALPSPVVIRPEPDGVALADPAFEALPGATAEYGRLGGTVYRIEMPDDWNGRLVLYMHGFEYFGPEAGVSAPDFRRWLIAHGYAWGASSFSSTSQIAGRAADETAALWDLFARKHGRPERSYISGLSMGGVATHIAASRYGDRYDGALALCGSAGNTAGAEAQTDFIAAGAYVAGVSQAEFDAAPDRGRIIDERILPALADSAAHARFEDIVLDVTGGPRPFGREGLHLEEETVWESARVQIAAGLASNVTRRYALGPQSDVPSDVFNREAVRFTFDPSIAPQFLAGSDADGALAMPLLTMHTTGDGLVPIAQARILRERAEAAGKGDLLAQRIYADPSHCGFTTPEWEDGLRALVAWVEEGRRPDGDDVTRDLSSAGGRFLLQPRPGGPAADAVPGASARARLGGAATVDGEPFDARWLGAVVLSDGMATACQYTLPPVDAGRYAITVLAAEESAGCGAPGGEIVLWTYIDGERLFSEGAVPWPGDGVAATFDASFSKAAPAGASLPVTEFNGEVYTRDGEHAAPGTRIEARVGGVLCGVASTRRTGNYAGYILSVAGEEAVAGCTRGAPLAFTIDGAPARETALNDGEGRGGLDLSVR